MATAAKEQADAEAGKPANTVVAAADPAKAGADASDTPAAPQIPVRIRIVEAEQQGGFYVSGYAAPGSRVRLYLNRSYIAEAQTGKDGTWSMRVGRGMSPGDYNVRADVVEPVTGKVLSRAEVPFDYPVRIAAAPASGTPGNTAGSQTAVKPGANADANEAVAAASRSPAGASPASGAAASAPETAARTAPVTAGNNTARAAAEQPSNAKVAAPQSSGVTPPAVTAQGNGASLSAPAKRQARTGAPAQTASATPGAQRANSGQTESSQTETARAGAEQAAPGGTAASAVGPAASPSPSKSVAAVAPQPSGNAGGLLPPAAPAAHVVIEKLTTASVTKGDSLWRISRNIYGRGIRYTQIYAANTSQIRNPHLIYPGQVLVVPLGDPKKGPVSPASGQAPAPDRQ